jgi:hypothetical protein
MQPLRESLERLLAAHQPNPALIVDGLWNLFISKSPSLCRHHDPRGPDPCRPRPAPDRNAMRSIAGRHRGSRDSGEVSLPTT